MKTLVYLMAGAFLVSFSSKDIDAVDGIWTGVYRTDNLREKVLVKFDPEHQIELYNGEVIESNKFTGTYQIQGDTLLKFSYQNSEGKQFTMKGSINSRKNYVDGVWETSDKRSGSFYLKKEKIQEMYIQP